MLCLGRQFNKNQTKYHDEFLAKYRYRDRLPVLPVYRQPRIYGPLSVGMVAMENAPFCPAIATAWLLDYQTLDRREADKIEKNRLANVLQSSLQRHMARTLNYVKEDGFSRLEKCRMALRVLDENGWKRSFHQREFHEVRKTPTPKVLCKLTVPHSYMSNCYYHPQAYIRAVCR